MFQNYKNVTTINYSTNMLIKRFYIIMVAPTRALVFLQLPVIYGIIDSPDSYKLSNGKTNFVSQSLLILIS